MNSPQPARGQLLRIFLTYILPLPLVLIIALQPTLPLRLAFALAFGVVGIACGVYLDLTIRLVIRDAIERASGLCLRADGRGTPTGAEKPPSPGSVPPRDPGD